MIKLTTNSKLLKVKVLYINQLPDYLAKYQDADLTGNIIIENDDHQIIGYDLIKLDLEKIKDLNNEYLRKELMSLFARLKGNWSLDLSISDIASYLDLNYLVKLIGETYTIATYRFSAPFKEKGPSPDLELVVTNPDLYLKDLEVGIINGEGVNNARHLADLPANFLKPVDLEKYARHLVEELSNPLVTIETLGNDQLKAIGAGALLGVNQGSAEEARLIVLKYNGAKDLPYTALIGKGLTYDSGGYNLKTNGGAGMKYDMCGAANVLGAFEIIVRTNKEANVYAIVPATENMIGPNAYRVDDVLVSLSGKTIEVTNTDAEGRLALCDAISYAVELGVKQIIDIATLTGAVASALGKEYTGAFTNSYPFYQQFEEVTKRNHETVWLLPVNDNYAATLKKSKIADLVNSVREGGGASIAACFLKEFVPQNVEWIHLDVAGTATADNMATGVMVRSLADFFK